MKAVAIHFHDRLSLGHITRTQRTVRRLVSCSYQTRKKSKILWDQQKMDSLRNHEISRTLCVEEKQAMYVDGVHRITSMSQIEDENTAWVVVRGRWWLQQARWGCERSLKCWIVHVGVVKCPNQKLCKDVKVLGGDVQVRKNTRPRSSTPTSRSFETYDQVYSNMFRQEWKQWWINIRRFDST